MVAIAPTTQVTMFTIRDYLRKRIRPIFRKKAILALLLDKGLISFNHGGLLMDWKLLYKRRKITPGPGNPNQVSFPLPENRKVNTLPWRSYFLGETSRKIDRLMNKGEQALWDMSQEALDMLSKDFLADFGSKVYIDGGSANSLDIHGLETMFSYSGTITSSPALAPNDTYGDLLTTLGQYGGEWSVAGNEGWSHSGTDSDDVRFNFHSPLILDTQSSFWPGASNTWQLNWQYILNYAHTHTQHYQDFTPDAWVLHSTLLRQAKDSLVGQERLDVNHNTGLALLGFKTVKYDGVELTTDSDCPSDTGYGLYFGDIEEEPTMELRSMQSELIDMDSDEDITTADQLKRLDFFGNLLFTSPAYFVKLVAETALGT